ncbi:DUF4156 domain-containing protein [Thiogranum longum]
MKSKKALCGLAAVFAMANFGACALMDSQEAESRVRVATAASVRDCVDAGTTRISILDKADALHHSQDDLSSELLRLARRSAVELGGNTIVPVTEIVDGVQTFAVYRCRHRH